MASPHGFNNDKQRLLSDTEIRSNQETNLNSNVPRDVSQPDKQSENVKRVRSSADLKAEKHQIPSESSLTVQKTASIDSEGVVSVPIPQANASPIEKTMTLFSACTLIVTSIIGGAIFASPGPILGYAHSFGAALIIWVLAGFLTLCGCLCYAELGMMIPGNGGEHPYLSRAFGSLMPFLFSWTSILVIRPASIAIIAVICAEYSNKLVYGATPASQVPGYSSKLIAISVVIVLTIVNILSTRLGRFIQNFCTILKVMSLTAIGVIGVYALVQGGASLVEGDNNTIFNGTSRKISDHALALYTALWTYDGWNNLNLVAGELKNPNDLPKALIISPIIVLICYLFANLAYYAELPFATIISTKTIGMEFGAAVMGAVGAIIIPIVVIGSTFGSTNADIFASARVSMVASKNGHAPLFLSKISSKTNTPLNALVFQGIVTLIYAASSSFENLVTFFCIIAWTFYLSTVFGLLVLRYTEPQLPRPFKVWIIVPVLFVLSCLLLLIITVMNSPLMGISAYLFLLSGILPWWIVVRKQLAWEDIIPFIRSRIFGGWMAPAIPWSRRVNWDDHNEHTNLVLAKEH